MAPGVTEQEVVSRAKPQVSEVLVAEPHPSARSGHARRATPARLIELLEMRIGRFSGLVVWLAFIVAFGLVEPTTFLTSTTATSIAGGQAVTLVLALGLVIGMSAGQFDLSIGANLTLGSVVCLVLMSEHRWNPVLAAVVAVLVCTIGGGLMALLVVVVGVDSPIAGLAVSSVLLAFSEWITGGQYVGPAPRGFQDIAASRPLGIPILLIYAIGAALVVWYVLEHTPVGRRVHATGANPETSRLVGIATYRYVAGSLLATGFLCGIAGVLLAAQFGSVDPSVGTPYLLPTFAACFLGSTQIKPGRFNVWGTAVAIYLLATAAKGFELAGSASWISDMFNGAALVAAVGLAALFRRRRAAKLNRATTARTANGTSGPAD